MNHLPPNLGISVSSVGSLPPPVMPPIIITAGAGIPSVPPPNLNVPPPGMTGMTGMGMGNGAVRYPVANVGIPPPRGAGGLLGEAGMAF